MINYRLISAAIEKYQDLGYTFIDVPWVANQEAIDITLPPNKRAFILKNKFLVGSAEQSFLHLILNGKLPEGKYVAATPCFRDDIEDEYHQKYFFKVELIKYSKIYQFDHFDLINVVADANVVQASLCSKKIEAIKTNEGIDLTINNIEIGSYGIRKYKNFNWIYGTGLAEPRFSKLI